ncbi:MAG: formyltetrahydrofolate deformylase [Bacteroidetes Order II. Incertae sedis bacterium]|nr:formyltetrahydrofolate deformylase [Bacteroidetes Order II. bacterium]
MQDANTARLLISCPDRSGIVAAVSQFMYSHGANILDADQHSTDPTGGTFFMRMVFYLDGLDISRAQFEKAFARVVGDPFQMKWQISYADQPKKMALLVSKYDHCFMELLWRWQRKELSVEIPIVVSNHPDMAKVAEQFGIPYHYMPVTKETKPEQEVKILELLKDVQADLVVLARYMQILSSEFTCQYPNKIINIHHSFLPAFIGANPYQRAYDRGVKLIGATAHYVTSDLDEGPIIDQDVQRVSHREDVADLVRIGRDIERRVLARAVQAHIEDRVLVYQNKTVVF